MESFHNINGVKEHTRIPEQECQSTLEQTSLQYPGIRFFVQLKPWSTCITMIGRETHSKRKPAPDPKHIIGQTWWGLRVGMSMEQQTQNWVMPSSHGKQWIFSNKYLVYDKVTVTEHTVCCVQ